MPSTHWIDLARDLDTGIETLHAPFQGHAYDPHWHDSYLVGVTRQGVFSSSIAAVSVMPARLGRCSHWSRMKSIMAMLRAPKALPIRCCLDHPRPHQYPGIKQQCPLRLARRRTFDSGHLHRCCTVGAARRHGSRPLIWQRGSVLWTVCESGGWGAWVSAGWQ